MKKIIFVILTFLTSQASACNYSSLYDYLENVDDTLKIQVKDCTKKSRRLRSKEKVCECVNNNIKVFKPDNINFDNFHKRKFVDKALEKAKIGLLDISEEILATSQDKNMQFDLSENCDLNNRLGNTGKSKQTTPIFECAEGINTVLNESDRKNIANTLASKFVSEIKQKNGEDTQSKGLINRKDAKFKNKCGLHDGFAMGVKQSMIKPQLAQISELFKENLANIQDSKNITQAINKLISQLSNNEDRKNLEELSKSVLGNPTLKKMLGLKKSELPEDIEFNKYSEKVFQDLLSSNFSPDKVGIIFDEALKSKDLSTITKKVLENKCNAVFNNLNKTLCLSSSDNLIPSDNSETKALFKSFETNNDQNDFIITSSILSKNYCNNVSSSSKLDEIINNINQTLPSILHNEDKLTNASEKDYIKSYKSKADIMCDALAGGLTGIDSSIQQACKKEPGQILDNQICIMLQAAQPKLKEILAKQNMPKALEMAKKEMETSGQKTDSASLAKRASEIAEGMSNGLDMKSIVSVVNKYMDTKKSRLVNDFIGGEAEKIPTPNVALSNIDDQSTQVEIGRSTTSSNSNDNSATNFTGANLNTSAVPTDLQQALSYQEKKTQDKMDKLYQRISNQITRSRTVRSSRSTQNTRDLNAVANKVLGPPTPSIPSDLSRAIQAPGPQFENDDLSSSEDFSYEDEDLVAQNFYDDNSQNNFFENTTDEATPAALATNTTPKTVENRGQQQYNKALASANQAKQEAKRKAANAGKIKPSPFKSLGQSIAGGRSPASLSKGGISSKDLTFAKQSLPLNPETVQNDLETLIDNVLAEKEKGIKGENLEHATAILGMLGQDNSKAVTIKSDQNPDFEVQILKKKNGLKLVPLGNMADPAYKNFFGSINKFVIGYGDKKYKKDFSKLLDKLKLAVDKGMKVTETSPSIIRYQDITNYR